MMPLNLNNSLIQTIRAGEWNQALDELADYRIFEISASTIREVSDIEEASSSGADRYWYFMVSRKGGIFEGAFNKKLSHPNQNFKLTINFQYSFQFTEDVIPSLGSFLYNHGRAASWDFRALLTNTIQKHYEFFLKTKIHHGVNIFDSFFDLVDEAVTYTADQISLQLNTPLQLTIQVEGEGQIGGMHIQEERIPLYYDGNKTPYFASVSLDLPVLTEGKSRAVALHNKTLLIRDKVLTKIQTYAESEGELKKLIQEGSTPFTTGLTTMLNTFLRPLGRGCEKVIFSLPFELPPVVWAHKFETSINSFAGNKPQSIHVDFEAIMLEGSEAISLASKASNGELVSMVETCATSLWKDRSMQSVMVNCDFEENELKHILSPRINTLGYAIKKLKIQFDANIPRKEERVAIEWTFDYPLKGSVTHLPITTLIEGRIVDLKPWEGKISAGFNLSKWAKDIFEMELTQVVRSFPLSTDLIEYSDTTINELTSKLDDCITSIAKKLGIELLLHSFTIDELAIALLSKRLKSGIHSLAIQGIFNEVERCFQIDYRIKGICHDNLDSFIDLHEAELPEILKKLNRFIKRRIQLPLNHFLEGKVKDGALTTEDLLAFERSYLTPMSEPIKLAFGMLLEGFTFFEIESDSARDERELKISLLKRRQVFLSSKADEYENFIQKDLENFMKELDTMHKNRMQFGEEAADIVHLKIRNSLKNYAYLLDSSELNQE